MAVRNFLSLSLSRVLLGLPSWPSNGRRSGPSRRPFGPLVGSPVRPDLGRAQRARAPRSRGGLPPGPSQHYTHPPCGGRAGLGGCDWSRPPASPCFPRGASVASLLCSLPLYFSVDSEVVVFCVCFCPVALGCPSCPFFQKQSFCNNSEIKLMLYN